jgi:ribosomal protein S18 acetylase RimI-like enzyme
MTPTVRLLGPDDADAYVALRRAMLRDAPLAFSSSPGDDRASDPAAVRAWLAGGPGQVIVGALAGGTLVGAVGLARHDKQKAGHRAHVWGMYVDPGHRRSGIGRALLGAALAHARTLPGVTRVDLAVSDATPGARRLYEAVGFRAWGTEPGALRWEGRTVDEHHMVRWLEPPDPGEPGRGLAGQTTRTGALRVALPADAALPLFTAAGETRWVPGWTPAYVSPPDGSPVEGGIFLTRDGDQEVIWRVQRYDPAARVAEYLRIVPGDRVVAVTVACEPEGAGTRATVTYRVTPLSAAGRAWLAAFGEGAFAAMLREWERLIAAHLGRA